MINFSTNVIKLLEVLLNIIKYKSLYVLGAGVSAAYIKPKYDLYEDAKISELLFFDSIITPIKDITLNSSEVERFRILGSPHEIHKTNDGKLLIDETNMDFRDILIHSNPSILEFVCAHNYSLDQFPDFCPEYVIFNLANTQSQVVNLNHDNLAENFISNLNVISIHGTIHPSFKKNFKNCVQTMFEHDTNNELLENLFLASREEEKLLLQNPPYKNFHNMLQNHLFKYIVIIGYSFFKKNDYDIYDEVTYNLICNYIHEIKPEVIIIDPNSYYVTDILAKRLTSLRAQCFDIYWDSFTNAFFYTNARKNLHFYKFGLNELRLFSLFYDYHKNSHSKVLNQIDLRKYA